MALTTMKGGNFTGYALLPQLFKFSLPVLLPTCRIQHRKGKSGFLPVLQLMQATLCHLKMGIPEEFLKIDYYFPIGLRVRYF
jgi:hypothetical protein